MGNRVAKKLASCWERTPEKLVLDCMVVTIQRGPSITSVTQSSRMENGPRPGLTMGVDLKGIGHWDLAQHLGIKSVTLGG